MKRITFIINCLVSKIKKKFFNDSKTDISHECEMMLNMNENPVSKEEMAYAKEYVENYNVTTRWQTL
jgi:hypothetical protein